MGMRRRLRKAEINEYKLRNGKHPFHNRGIGPGVKRAAERLKAKRKANAAAAKS